MGEESAVSLEKRSTSFSGHRARWMHRQPLFLVTVLCATACEPDPCAGVEVIPPSQTFSTDEVCQEASAFEAAASIGYGTTTFSPLNDNVVLEVEHGPQGGQHIFGSVLLTGMNPGERAFSEPRGCAQAEVYDPLSIIYTLSFPDQLYADVVGTGMGWLEGGTPVESVAGSILLVMDIWSVMAAYPDQSEVTLEAHAVATDACGTTVEDTGTFRLSLDE